MRRGQPPSKKMADATAAAAAAAAELEEALAHPNADERKRHNARKQAKEATKAMHKFARNMFFSPTEEKKCTIEFSNEINWQGLSSSMLKIVLGAHEPPKQKYLPEFTDEFGLGFNINFDQCSFHARFYSKGNLTYVSTPTFAPFPRHFLQGMPSASEAVKTPLRVWKLLDQLIPWIGKTDTGELYQSYPHRPAGARAQAWIAWGQTAPDEHKIVPFQLLDGTQADISLEAFIDAYLSEDFAKLTTTLRLEPDDINSDWQVNGEWKIATNAAPPSKLSNERGVYQVLCSLQPHEPGVGLFFPLRFTPSPEPKKRREASAELYGEEPLPPMPSLGKRKERDETSPGGRKPRRTAESAFVDA